MTHKGSRKIVRYVFGLVVWSGVICASGAELKYTVQKGDTVWSIARKYGVSPQEIVELNSLESPDRILPGQVLIVSGGEEGGSSHARSSVKHTVRKGETIWSISRKYGVEPDAIIEANKLRNPSLIVPGQVLVIVGGRSSGTEEEDIARLCRLPRGVRRRKWRYIVVHHSDTTTGNAAIFDRYHRNRGMENGLAYHFVIGNGKGAGDGEIQVAGRWTKQLHGGHTRNSKMNSVGVGICLVGNFDRYHPTNRQMDSLVRLVKHLMKEYGIPKSRVIGHRDVRGSPTRCPGKNFSLVELRKKL